MSFVSWRVDLHCTCNASERSRRSQYPADLLGSRRVNGQPVPSRCVGSSFRSDRGQKTESDQKKCE